MAKKKKDNFDAASLNKQQYIRDNYAAKAEDVPQGASNKSRQRVIVLMLSVLLVLVVFFCRGLILYLQDLIQHL